MNPQSLFWTKIRFFLFNSNSQKLVPKIRYDIRGQILHIYMFPPDFVCYLLRSTFIICYV